MVAAAQVGAERKVVSAGFIVAICFTIAALEGYDIQAVGVAGPSMIPSLHLTEAQVGFASSWSMIGLVIGSVIGGWFADRFGRKPVLLWSVVWFGIFSLVTASIHSAEMLLISRFLTGVGFGGAMPNMIAVASEISPPNRRAATTTTMFVGFPAGGTLATLVTLAVLTGYLPKTFDWRLVFMVGGVLPIAIAPLVWFFLPETRVIHEDEDKNVLRVLFGAGRTATTLVMWLSFALTLVVLYLLLGWLPMLVHAEGLTRIDGNFASLAYNMVSIVGGIGIGVLVDRYNFRWPLFFTYVGLIISLWLLSVSSGVIAIVALSGAAGFFIIGAQYNLYALAPMVYPKSAKGTGAGAAVGAGRLGSIVGPALPGFLHLGPNQVLGVTVPIIVVAGAAAFLLTYIGKVIDD